VVNTARLLDGSGQTEIRIEMQGDSLGGIELRAHISGDQMGATIAVEHRDAQLALATELPTLHSALAEKNIRLDTLSVSQGTFTSLSGGHGGDGGQKWFAQPRPNAIQAEQADPFVGLPDVQSEMTGTGVSNTGLSVLA
jgi:flagellar hook-length control protein FliK